MVSVLCFILRSEWGQILPRSRTHKLRSQVHTYDGTNHLSWGTFFHRLSLTWPMETWMPIAVFFGCFVFCFLMISGNTCNNSTILSYFFVGKRPVRCWSVIATSLAGARHVRPAAVALHIGGPSALTSSVQC